MKILHTFTKSIPIEISGEERRQGARLLNLHYTGDEECNVYDENRKLVAKYPEIEKSNPKFKESHYNLCRGFYVTIRLDLMEDGSLELVK